MTEYCYYIPLLGFYIDKTGVLVSISALLAVSALAYSTFASTYSNFLHSSEIAWVNWRVSRSPHRVYWHELAEGYRDGAQRRACSGNLIFYSLCSAIVSLILAIFTRCSWLILFWISVGFIIAALAIFTRENVPACLLKAIRKRGTLLFPLGRHLNKRFWGDEVKVAKELRQDFWDYSERRNRR